MKNQFWIIAIIGLFLMSFTSFNNPGLDIGDTAPDFKLKNVDGKMVSLADYKDVKGYIIIFSCNHCPFVIKYEERMIELHNEFAPKGYPVIAINPNDPEIQPADSFEKMVEKANEMNFPFAYLFDDGQKVFPQYGATRTPHVYLLDKNRKVKYIGAIDDNVESASKVENQYLVNAIIAIENGETPDPATTKAIGCSIKVKKN
jgi:peroxiredoxin